MKERKYSIAESYTKKPGPRYKWQGNKSGEDFLETVLLDLFEDCVGAHEKLVINLDKTVGYGSSFLEESFGGLVRIKNRDLVNKHLSFISKEEDFLIEEIQGYINDAETHEKA